LAVWCCFWQLGYGSEQVFGFEATGAVILARMREEYDSTHSAPAATFEGLGRTGRLVTSAASGSCSMPRSCALLVPALVSLLGQYNWWLPAGIARVLRVEPSPLRPDSPEPAPVKVPATVD